MTDMLRFCGLFIIISPQSSTEVIATWTVVDVVLSSRGRLTSKSKDLAKRHAKKHLDASLSSFMELSVMKQSIAMCLANCTLCCSLESSVELYLKRK
ncbi:hypothetical protein F0562_004945 [Nyssa sinensis]|uniref:Uncharacterized protein n=1 Tax=Nyssa sinensis TaxID=561372 RepID=A0A5J5AKQ1_9ASTE|nr:hypothetical protein F0562_004945 [Nyssa sinensis]